MPETPEVTFALPRRVLGTCPMCDGRGERSRVPDGKLGQCPWCGGRCRVPLERARALRAQLGAKAARKGLA